MNMCGLAPIACYQGKAEALPYGYHLRDELRAPPCLQSQVAQASSLPHERAEAQSEENPNLYQTIGFAG